MSEHVKGLALTTLGVLFIVPDSLFVRLIDAPAITTAFWRNLIAGGLILAFVLATQGPRAVTSLAQTGRAGAAYLVFFGMAASGFVLAVSLTSVANVVFILAATPVFATVFSRVFLGEPISMRMVLTMAGVFVGLGIILRGSHETAGASWQGDLVALGVAACFAAAMTALRVLRGALYAGGGAGVTDRRSLGAAALCRCHGAAIRAMAAAAGAWRVHCLRVVTDDNGAALHHLCRSVAVVVAGIGAGTPAGLGAAGRKPWPMGHLGGGRS